MEEHSMLLVTTNNLMLRGVAIDGFLTYTHYYIDDLKAKLAQAVPCDVAVAEQISNEIAHAEALAKDAERIRQELSIIYRRDFDLFAEVTRETMLELGQTKIEKVYSLWLHTKNLMALLKAENRLFSEEKFITSINEGRLV